MENQRDEVTRRAIIRTNPIGYLMSQTNGAVQKPLSPEQVAEIRRIIEDAKRKNEE